VTATVTEAKPFFLIADPVAGESFPIRRTRAGDAWDHFEAESCGAPTPEPKSGGPVSIGLPTIRTGL